MYGSEESCGDNAYHLQREHANGLDRVFATAHVEQVLKIWTEQVDDEDVVETLLTEIVHLRNAL